MKKTLPRPIATKKLELTKETVRVLPDVQLQDVAGGARTNNRGCPAYTC